MPRTGAWLSHDKIGSQDTGFFQTKTCSEKGRVDQAEYAENQQGSLKGLDKVEIPKNSLQCHS